MAFNDPENLHASVLLPETIEILDPGANEFFVDATLGLGGHAEALLNRSPKIKIVGIDQDLDAIDNAKARLSRFGERFTAIHGNFSDITTILDDIGIKAVDGIL
ncbi:MAG TPA: 16S rRNA (cytosine(1402)-N(4))-methyltransferase, partial [Pyrinomonadaceae bacterium]|nr:16S rRNA (cytosine(1402)-N(4))-methyltransferase [Pyrinomonadaceae bacterium]